MSGKCREPKTTQKRTFKKRSPKQALFKEKGEHKPTDRTGREKKYLEQQNKQYPK